MGLTYHIELGTSTQVRLDATFLFKILNIRLMVRLNYMLFNLNFSTQYRTLIHI